MEPIEEIRKAISTNPPPAAEKPARHGTLIEPIGKLKAAPLPLPPTPTTPQPSDDAMPSTIAPAGKMVGAPANIPTVARPAAGRPPVGRPPVGSSPFVDPPKPTSDANRAPSSVDTQVEPPSASPAAVVTPFRPTLRPPMAVLMALDDGRDDGECWRVRQPAFVIGRTQGDAIIPHDSGISGQHCQISRREEGGVWRWFLTDLGSRNGTFMKAAKVPLKDRVQLLIGSRRYEFRSGTAADPPSGAFADAADATLLEQSLPSLVELMPEGDGRRYLLPSSDATLGSATACGLQILGDPYVSPIHARLSCDDSGRRFLENVNSLNGLWVRVQEQRVDQDFEFKAGEQRFLVRFP